MSQWQGNPWLSCHLREGVAMLLLLLPHNTARCGIITAEETATYTGQSPYQHVCLSTKSSMLTHWLSPYIYRWLMWEFPHLQLLSPASGPVSIRHSGKFYRHFIYISVWKYTTCKRVLNDILSAIKTAVRIAAFCKIHYNSIIMKGSLSPQIVAHFSIYFQPFMLYRKMKLPAIYTIIFWFESSNSMEFCESIEDSHPVLTV